MSTGNVQQLFRATLEGAYEDDGPWDAVRELHRIGTLEILDLAASWCESSDALTRARGADVLSQLGKAAGHPSHNFPVEAFAILSELIGRETEMRPLSSVIYALGHLGDASAVPLLVRHATNASPEVRHAVAFALGCYPNEPAALKVLLKLTADDDECVRDWATLAIGGARRSRYSRDPQGHCRSALRSEPGCARGGRGRIGQTEHRRVLEPLFEMLTEPEPGTRPFEAAELLLGMSQDDPPLTRDDYVNLLKSHF